MKLEAYFKPYPHLKALFWPKAEDISWDNKRPHPLMALVLGNDDKTRHVAGRTNNSCQQIAKHNPDWLHAKVMAILKEGDLANVSATLGEIRAFGELIWVWQNKVVAGNAGNDFTVEINGEQIRIEVNTPQHRTKRHAIEHKPTKSKSITSQITEVFPFGWPQRPGKDNVQGEAISKIASIKQKELQFEDKSINILWCDLKDPTLWPFDFGISDFYPVSMFQEQMSSGAFWNAFYAKKGTPVFHGLPVGGYERNKTYRMEYNGRYWSETKIDFLVADTRRHQIVFQNPNRHRVIPDLVFRDLHRLFTFNIEASWVDWPARGQLKTEVEMALKNIAGFETAFEDAEVLE